NAAHRSTRRRYLIGIGGPLDDAEIDRFQRIVRCNGAAGLAVAIGAGDAAAKKRALIDHIKATGELRGHPHRKTDQRQTPPAGPADHATLDPLGLTASRQEALELDVGRRDPLQRTDAEGLDAQLPAQCPDPIRDRETADRPRARYAAELRWEPPGPGLADR